MKMYPVCEYGPAPSIIDLPVSDQYYVVMEKMTWEASVATCAAHGDHLVAITSEGEATEVKNVLEHNFDNAFNEKFWIGLHMPDPNTPVNAAEAWKWTDASPVRGFTDWDVEQPGDHTFDELCGAIGWGRMKWHDASCNLKMYPVCEVGVGSVAPTPVTVVDEVDWIMPAMRPMATTNTPNTPYF